MQCVYVTNDETKRFSCHVCCYGQTHFLLKDGKKGRLIDFYLDIMACFLKYENAFDLLGSKIRRHLLRREDLPKGVSQWEC